MYRHLKVRFLVPLCYLFIIFSEVTLSSEKRLLQMKRGKRDIDLLAECDEQCLLEDQVAEYDILLEYDYEEDDALDYTTRKPCSFPCTIVGFNKTGGSGNTLGAGFSIELVEEPGNEENSESKSSTDSDSLSLKSFNDNSGMSPNPPPFSGGDYNDKLTNSPEINNSSLETDIVSKKKIEINKEEISETTYDDQNLITNKTKTPHQPYQAIPVVPKKLKVLVLEYDMVPFVSTTISSLQDKLLTNDNDTNPVISDELEDVSKNLTQQIKEDLNFVEKNFVSGNKSENQSESYFPNASSILYPNLTETTSVAPSSQMTESEEDISPQHVPSTLTLAPATVYPPPSNESNLDLFEFELTDSIVDGDFDLSTMMSSNDSFDDSDQNYTESSPLLLKLTTPVSVPFSKIEQSEELADGVTKSNHESTPSFEIYSSVKSFFNQSDTVETQHAKEKNLKTTPSTPTEQNDGTSNATSSIQNGTKFSDDRNRESTRPTILFDPSSTGLRNVTDFTSGSDKTDANFSTTPGSFQSTMLGNNSNGENPLPIVPTSRANRTTPLLKVVQ